MYSFLENKQFQIEILIFLIINYINNNLLGLKLRMNFSKVLRSLILYSYLLTSLMINSFELPYFIILIIKSLE